MTVDHDGEVSSVGQSNGTSVSDPFRDSAWFAEQIGMSVDWVRRNIKGLPHHKVGRLTKFDEHCVNLLREQTTVVPHDPIRRTDRPMPTRRRRRRAG